MTDAQIFKISQAALDEWAKVIRQLRTGLILAIGLGGWALAEQSTLLKALGWPLLALLGAAVWRFQAGRLLETFALRELRVQGNALELVNGKFTRLLFFSQLEQLRMIQGKDEKVLAIELRTMESAVTLRGYENMEALFTALNARKPAKVLIEVEEARVDQTSVTFWSRVIWIFGALALLAALAISYLN